VPVRTTSGVSFLALAVAAGLGIGYLAGRRRALPASVAAAAAALAVAGAQGRLVDHAAAGAATALAAALAVLLGSRLRRDADAPPGDDRVSPGTLDYEVRRALRNDRPLSLLVVRPDDPAADRDALERSLASTMRSSDFAAGHSGPDVWLVLPEATSDAARVAAERFRLAVGTAGQPVSIGIASFPEDGDSGTELAAAARQALERAAELGGNRTLLRTAPEHAPRGWGLSLPSAGTTLRS
jgi:Diguanylate cyclase, GGDEF domain